MRELSVEAIEKSFSVREFTTAGLCRPLIDRSTNLCAILIRSLDARAQEVFRGRVGTLSHSLLDLLLELLAHLDTHGGER